MDGFMKRQIKNIHKIEKKKKKFRCKYCGKYFFRNASHASCCGEKKCLQARQDEYDEKNRNKYQELKKKREEEGLEEQLENDYDYLQKEIPKKKWIERRCLKCGKMIKEEDALDEDSRLHKQCYYSNGRFSEDAIGM